MSLRRAMLLAGLLVTLGCGGADSAPRREREPILGGPCEGCDLVFLGMPERVTTIPSVARIAPVDEPGEPMTIAGIVRDRSGAPRAGIIVYAYHTDEHGIYPDSKLKGNRHGALRGWARTDANGAYRFDTIRPGGYPDTNIPQHVHLHVLEPGRGTYWIDEMVFRDDPRLTPEQERGLAYGRGGPGAVTPTRDDAGRWHVVRDIVLGAGLSDYPADGK
jgi:protocatechuate 3,4-dioxygenase beta subunit